MSIQLTKEQSTAVTDRGGGLLVSAAAGSGKTRVLVERLFRHVSQGANIDEFLIITYTRAAAGELRGKIAAELSRRVAEAPEDAHLRRQLYRVYQADIRTVDAFCGSILRENIHLIKPVQGISLTPDFRVLDPQEAALLEQRVLERVLEQFYDSMDEQDRQLAETLGAGRDDRKLEELVLQLYEKTRSHPYPMPWLEEMRRRWEIPLKSLADSDCGRVIMEDTVRRAEFWSIRLRREAERMASQPELANAYADRFLEVAEQLEGYRTAAGSWAAMAAVAPKFRIMGRVEDSPEKQRSRALLERCKADLKRMAAPYLVSEDEYLEDLQFMAPAMLSLIRLTGAFAEAYRQEKLRRNAVDFSDQEHDAIDMLLDGEGQPTELAERIAQRYREIMVDEYQDSNAVQDCIFRAISRRGENLFTVGDVKQSIYRFRLADPGIFLKKYLSYRDAAAAKPGEPRRVLLSRNFRSRETVVDAVNFIFGNIMSREMGEMDYGENEQLYCGAAYLPRKDADTEYHLISVEETEEGTPDRTQTESEFIARRIRSLLDEGYPVQEGDGFRPCRPEDIVILLRSPRARLHALSAALTAANIPCSSQEDEDFFTAAEIASVLSLLQIIDNPRQDIPLIAALRSPLFGFTADRLAAVRALRPEGDYYDALLLDDSPETLRFLTLLAELRSAAREEAVDTLLWRVYDSCHVPAIFGAMPGGESRRQRLVALYSYAREMAAAGKRSLFDFVSHLRLLLERGDAPALSVRRGGGVQIMSIHSAKGLEFPVVILGDLHREFSRKDIEAPVLVHPELGLGTALIDAQRHIRYDTVTRMAVARQLLRENRAEEMRLLYVAMTRAKEKLILVQCMRRARKRLQDLAGVTDCPVPPQAVGDARCLGDWILLPLLNTPEASALRQWAEVPAGEMVSGAGSWTVKLWHNPNAAAAEKGEAAGAGSEAQDALAFDPAPLEWEYALQHSTAVPTKVTATQLKGREWDEEIRGDTDQPVWRPAFNKPRFLQTADTLSGAERGTAVHLVMQYIDFCLPAEEAAVRQAIEELGRRRLLTEAQAAAVEPRVIVDFLASPLCRRIRSAARVYREYRFNLLTDASVYDSAAAGEEIMLQGVVDCAFETPEGLVIVDFKTDRITTEQQAARAEYYRTQLEAYALALGRVLEKPVAEKILYFFHTKTAVTL